ncbi:MAG: cupin domain-containing protein [Dehalococcoidia bacterium]|jgi:quercetin dioxygenase-like cupin family protein
MFRLNDEATPFEMFPGIVRRALTGGERMTLCEITLYKDAVVPLHSHEDEQAGYVIRGRMLFKIGEEEREIGAGYGYLAPGNVPHALTALEDSLIVEVFSPPRKGYLDS